MTILTTLKPKGDLEYKPLPSMKPKTTLYTRTVSRWIDLIKGVKPKRSCLDCFQEHSRHVHDDDERFTFEVYVNEIGQNYAELIVGLDKIRYLSDDPAFQEKVDVVKTELMAVFNKER